MVKAYYKNNRNDYKKLNTFHVFVARGIRIYVFPALFFMFALCFFGLAIWRGNSTLYFAGAVLMLGAGALPLVYWAVQNAKVEKKVRNNKVYEKTEMFYEFDRDAFLLRIRAEQREEEYRIPYAQVLRIYERKSCFYLYIGRSQVLILPKTGIEAGQEEALVEYFRSINKRFREKKKYREPMQYSR